MLGNNHSGKWVLFPASSMDGMALSVSVAQRDVCRSAVWSSQENCSRKLNPWEVLSICSSSFLSFCCQGGWRSNSFPKSWMASSWRPHDRTVEQKGRRCLGPCPTSHVCTSLDFFHMKKFAFWFTPPLFYFPPYIALPPPHCYSGSTVTKRKNKRSKRTWNAKLGWQRKPANISELGFYVLLFKIINVDIYATEGGSAIISSINST